MNDLLSKENFSIISREISIMMETRSQFVAKYINYWTEGHKFLGRKIETYVFIQMELCQQNLEDSINFYNKLFDDKFTIFKYYMFTELLFEIIECVNYLHTLPTPIIHRDLKPQNILVSNGKDGRFLKLCDFGLAKFMEQSKNSRFVGTAEYMAPEVKYSETYDKSADIYSLGIVSSDLFQIKERPKFIRDQTAM